MVYFILGHGLVITTIVYVCGMRLLSHALPDSKVHGANMGPIWGRQDPGGPHVGPMNFVIWANFERRLRGNYIPLFYVGVITFPCL